MKELTLDAIVSNIDTVTDFVNEELEAHGYSFKARTQIDVAIDELFGNIARYAYKEGTGKVTVRLEYDPDGHELTITFIDNGIPFDPLKRDDPDIHLSAEEREIGGLGIFVVKRTMDAVEYEYKDDCNVLKIRKVLV